jgi:hypothetical protein
VVRSWAYLGKRYRFEGIFYYREFRKRHVYKIFKSTTKLRRANLPRYLHILKLTYAPRRRYSRRQRQTSWAALRFIPVAWARLYISDKSVNRFYQSLQSLPITSLGADPLVLIRRSAKIAKDSALSSFSATRRTALRLKGKSELTKSIFLSFRGTPLMTGILAFDTNSMLNGGLAAPWGVVYDNLVFSYNTQPTVLYSQIPIGLSILTDLVLNQLLVIYKVLVLLTLTNTKHIN